MKNSDAYKLLLSFLCSPPNYVVSIKHTALLSFEMTELRKNTKLSVSRYLTVYTP